MYPAFCDIYIYWYDYMIMTINAIFYALPHFAMVYPRLAIWEAIVTCPI